MLRIRWMHPAAATMVESGEPALILKIETTDRDHFAIAMGLEDADEFVRIVGDFVTHLRERPPEP